MRALRSVLAGTLIAIAAPPAGAQDRQEAVTPAAYFDRHAEGWFWYQDPPPEASKEDNPARPVPTAAPEAPDPVAQLGALRKQIQTALAAAILHPTGENVKTYMALNQVAMQRSQDFALSVRRALWTTPALDYSLTHPVNDEAVHVFRDEGVRQADGFLRATAREYGMFFFFKGSCPYCHKLAPILARFAATYGFRIIPVSLDGGALPEFPHPRVNAQAAVRLQVDTVPAVFLVRPDRGEVYPVAFGFVGWQELRERIVFLLQPQPAGTPAPMMTAATVAPWIATEEDVP